MPDICSNRHGNNPQSVAANLRVEPTKAAMRELIYDHLLRTGPKTGKELARHFGKLSHEISGRLTKLKADGLIRTTGRVREGAAEVEIIQGQLRLF